MAQRFGGKFSKNNAAGAPNGRQVARFGMRVNLLFLAPLPLAIRAFGQDAGSLAIMLAALGVLLLSAWLTREGVAAHAAYDARRVARRPALPRKIIAADLTGIGIFLAVFASGEVISGFVLGVVGMILHLLAFGLDPLRDKGMDGVDSYQSDRVARAVGEAEKHLSAMSDAIKRAGDGALERRVADFQATARDMFRTVEDDPRDLTAARRYLGVYLLGASDATAKFADLYARNRDPDARADFAALLDDLENNFAARTKALLSDDRSDLTIEIEVLRERLEREGVRAGD